MWAEGEESRIYPEIGLVWWDVGLKWILIMNEAAYIRLPLVLNFAVLSNGMPCSFSLYSYLIFLLIYFNFVLNMYLVLGALVSGI